MSKRSIAGRTYYPRTYPYQGAVTGRFSAADPKQSNPPRSREHYAHLRSLCAINMADIEARVIAQFVNPVISFDNRYAVWSANVAAEAARAGHADHAFTMAVRRGIVFG